MPESTPGQRAVWRVQRALKSGKEPKAVDLEMMKIEGLEIEGLQLPQLQSSSQPLNQPFQPLQSAQEIHPTFQSLASPPVLIAGREQASKEGSPGLSEQLPQRKPVGQVEKDWYDYFAFRFGPWIVLVLWFCTASLEKATFYAPTPEECKGIALPAAKLAKKVEDLVKVPKWVHTAFTSSDDITTTGMVIVGYLDRIGVLEKLVPYYMGLANRMGAVNAKYRHKNPVNRSEGQDNLRPSNGSIPEPPGYNAAAFYGLGGQHSPN